MANIPLVDNNDKNSINTSVIAIKKEIEQIEGLLQNARNKLKSLSDNDFLYRSDLTDTVESGNKNPVTSNGVAGAIASVETDVSGKVDKSKSVSVGTTNQTTSINNDGDILKLEYQHNSSGGTNRIQLLLGMINNAIKGVFKSSQTVAGTTTENTLEIDMTNGLKYNNSKVITKADVDATPTANSTNPVQSGGVYTALEDKLTGKKITYYGSQSVNLYYGGRMAVIYSSLYAGVAGCFIALSNYNTTGLLIKLGASNFNVTIAHVSNGVDKITVTTGSGYSWNIVYI